MLAMRAVIHDRRRRVFESGRLPVNREPSAR